MEGVHCTVKSRYRGPAYNKFLLKEHIDFGLESHFRSYLYVGN